MRYGIAQPEVAIRGSFAMDINFSNNTMSGAIFANTPDVLSFTGAVTAHGISGTVGTGGVITGTFFGPQAASVGGNFVASSAGGGYLGIFGADKVGPFTSP